MNILTTGSSGVIRREGSVRLPNTTTTSNNTVEVEDELVTISPRIRTLSNAVIMEQHSHQSSSLA